MEVNARRRREDPFAVTPLPASQSAALGDEASLAGGVRRLAQEGEGQREAQRLTLRTFQRCAPPTHGALGSSLLGFELLSVMSAGMSLGFIVMRRRQQRRGALG
jgi:hypothetical protein